LKAETRDNNCSIGNSKILFEKILLERVYVIGMMDI